ncbi:MAG: hypothetical protein OHK0048_11820 [Rhodoferax sp.]
MLIGFLHRGGLEQWSYAILADISAQGVDAMRFTSADVDAARRMVHAEFWQQGRWVKCWTPYPQAVRNFEFRDEAQDAILRELPYTLGRHLRKDDQLALLAQRPGVSAYVPATIAYRDVDQVMDCLARWPGVILKPARGRLGQGIVFVRPRDADYEFETQGQRQTLSAKDLRQTLLDFMARTDRGYVVQQFAATTGPHDRYFNVRIIVHKGGDGDWYACGFGLSLLARPGSVVANREAGAVNVSLEAMLMRRFGDRAAPVRIALFTAAVEIARELDDALAQQADELALDMALDDHGAPWLHEVNWRGGFWALQEDVALYRLGGANVTRIARRHQFGVDPALAHAVDLLKKNRAPTAIAASADGHFFNYFGVRVTRRSDDTVPWLIQAWQHGVRHVMVSQRASFGAALRSVAQALELLNEQVGTDHGLRVHVGLGGLTHDSNDPRAPERWVAEEWVAKGLVSAHEAQQGVSWTPAFLRQQWAQISERLGRKAPEALWLEGFERLDPHAGDAWPCWLGAARSMTDLCRTDPPLRWGVLLAWSDLQRHRETLSAWLQTARAQDCSPEMLGVLLPGDGTEQVARAALALCAEWGLTLVCIPEPLPPRPKDWGVPHRQLPAAAVQSLCQQLDPDTTEPKFHVFAPLANASDWADCLELLPPASETPTMTADPLTHPAAETPLQPHQRRALQRFAAVDPRQLFRFFVDGRFHKKYRGWVGYEENEAGSVKGIVDAYTLMLKRFSEANPLNTGYLRDLHIACMAGVATKNRKSTPGELRYLESGINLYHGKSTRASVQELLDQRRGDGNIIFHHPDYQRTAESFSADEILDILAREGRVRYRAWYPNISAEQLRDLQQPESLSAFYAVKHAVQRCFAERTDAIVAAYNQEMALAQTDAQRLLAISRVVRDLELLHPFPDGNGRCFVAVLMNHLLLSHGFLPAILWDPNIDAELSVQEFADEIARGMANTEALIAQPAMTLYDFSIDASPEADVRAFQHLSKEFWRALNALAWGETEGQTQTSASRLALTPQALAQVCGGTWQWVDAQIMDTLRFDRVALEADAGADSVLFLRQLADAKARGVDPAASLNQAAERGIRAVVTDDAALAQRLKLPTLVVSDVDDALYEAACAVRRQIHSKAVAILGTEHTATARKLLVQALGAQVVVQDQARAAKTPQVMAALANLKRTDQAAVFDVVTGARPNVARHRLNAIKPFLCWFCSAENAEQEPAATYQDVLKTLGACAEGLVEGGLCLINANSPASDALCEEIRQRSGCAIQTYGSHGDDPGRLLAAQFDARARTWTVKAEIFGQTLQYQVEGDASAPLMSVGALLVVANLGLSPQTVAEQVWV